MDRSKSQNPWKKLGKIELIGLYLGIDREEIFTKSWVELDSN